MTYYYLLDFSRLAVVLKGIPVNKRSTSCFIDPISSSAFAILANFACVLLLSCIRKPGCVFPMSHSLHRLGNIEIMGGFVLVKQIKSWQSVS